MTAVTLRKRIAASHSIVEALRILQAQDAPGALIIKTGELEGSIAIIKGHITSAVVSPTGERGEEALTKLASVERASLRYSKFYGMHSSGKVIDITIDDYLERLRKPASPALLPPTPEAPTTVAIETATEVRPVPVRPSQVPLATAIAAIAIFALGASILPAQIKSTAGGGTIEKLAQQRLRRTMQETLSNDELLKATVLIPNKTATPSAVSTDSEAPINDDLRFARQLVTRGYTAQAAAYYETYLKLFPNAIKPRIELANVYLSTNRRADARLLCLRTFKKHLTAEEMTTVWQLLSQCQTD